jgi:signal transduction histidine kinase
MNIHRVYRVLLYNTLLLFSLSFSARLCAQNADSLQGVLNERSLQDTTKVRLYAATAYAYRYTNPDSILSIADRGIALAEKLQFDKGKADCLRSKIVAFVIFGDVEQGLKHGQEALAILQKAKDSVGAGLIYYYLGALYYGESKFEISIDYYLKTIQAYQHTENYDLLAKTFDNIGVCYSSIGNFSESLKYYLEALKINEKDNNREGIATCYGNIGRVYASLGKKKMALDYINKSLARQEGASVDVLMLNYENAGNVYLNINDTLKALAAFEYAIHLVDSAGQYDKINRIYVNLAEVLLTMGNYGKAFDLYQQCLANNKYPNMPAVDGMINRGLGRIYVKRKQYKEGAKYLKTSLDIFRETEMKDHITETLKDLAAAYAGLGEFEKAYATIIQYNAYRDTILNDETNRKVQEMQYEYDLQKKQTAIEILQKNKMIAEGNADKQRAVSIGLVSGLALLLIIIAIMYRSRKRETVAKNLIQLQATSLSELNSYKDKIFSVLSHDLRGPIGSLTTTMELLDENIITPAEFSELKPQVHKQLTSITLLLDNLLKWSMNHLTGGKAIKIEKLNLHQLVTQNINLLQNTIDEKTITLHNNVSADIRATGDKSNVDIIIRNLISNAIKFTNPDGIITIAADTYQGKVRLSVTDNGVGMNKTQISKLFTASSDNSSAGTMGEKGIGLGLLMSYEFAKANNGDIIVASEPGKGSTFSLELPG